MSTVGSILREAREAKGISVSDLAERTRIKVQQVNGLERDDFSVSPAPMYTKGFLKLCAQELDLDPAELLLLFTEQTAAVKPSRPVARAGALKPALVKTPPQPVPHSSPAQSPAPSAVAEEESAVPESAPAPGRRIPVRASLRPAGTDVPPPKREFPDFLGGVRKMFSRISLPRISLDRLPLESLRIHLPKIGAGAGVLLLLFLIVRGCGALSSGSRPIELREPLLLEPLPLRLPLPGASA